MGWKEVFGLGGDEISSARHTVGGASVERLMAAGYGDVLDLVMCGCPWGLAIEAWQEVRLDRQLEAAMTEEETAKYAVVLTAYSGKIHAIKAIRQVSGLGLKEAKDASESLPFRMGGDWSRGRAEEVKGVLTRAGALCHIEPSGSTPAAGD